MREKPSFPDGRAHTGIDYGALLAEAQAQPEALQPVEIERGLEIRRRTTEAVTILRDELVPELDLGHNTRQAYHEVLSSLLDRPDGIRVTKSSGSYYRNALLSQEGVEMSHETGIPTLEIGELSLANNTKWLNEAATRANVELTAPQLDQLATVWLAWHEAGHGLQAAYRNVLTPPDPSRSINYANLSLDMMAHGPSQPVFPDTKLSSIEAQANEVAEQEGFAEGFGQMLVEQYAVSHLGLDPGAAQRLREELTPPLRKERLEITKQVIQEVSAADADPSTDASSVNPFSQIRLKLAEHGIKGMGNLGYGKPHSPSHVREILKHMS